MPGKIHFIFCAHNHQPVGNFAEIFETAYQRAYRPFLEVFSKNPNLKLCLHNSGSLYDFFIEKHPEHLDAIAKLVSEHRLEILSGAYYEPILTLIPQRDIVGQIRMMNEFLLDRMKYKATGMWLPERVWDPHLADPIRIAGMRYTTLDTGHFLMAGLNEDKLHGYYMTEEHGKLLGLYCISRKLRYMIPYKPVNECIEYLRQLASDEEDRVVVMADDGEKFGLWPGSYRHVYEEQWLNNFFKALSENSSWITMTTFAEHFQKHQPAGRIYIPNASYSEMMEWALPLETQLKFREITLEIEKRGEEQKYAGLLRGGYFRNFLIKYREANRMHKKMIEVSERLHHAENDEETLALARSALYQGQCSCAYWHGVFGGLYLNHLRQSVYGKLIEAETYLDDPKHGYVSFDFNTDGYEEIKMFNRDTNIYLSPRLTGSLYEIDFKPSRVNILNCLTRQPEVYHPPIEDLVEAQEPGSTGRPADEKHQSIHTATFNMEKSLYEKIHYDWYSKTSFLDHFISHRTSLAEMHTCKFAERGSFIDQRYFVEYLEQEPDAVVVTLNRDANVWAGTFRKKINLKKTYKLHKDRDTLDVHYSVTNISDLPLALRMAIECNYGLGVFKAEKRYVSVNGKVSPQNWYFGALAEHPDVTSVAMIDEVAGYSITLNSDTPFLLWRYPIETVSRSEKGFEMTYQGTTLLMVFEFVIKPGESFRRTISQQLTKI